MRRGCATPPSRTSARAMIAAPSDIFRVLRHYGSTIGAVAAPSAVVGAAPIAAVAASGASTAVFGRAPVPRCSGSARSTEQAGTAGDTHRRRQGRCDASRRSGRRGDTGDARRAHGQVTPAMGSGAVAGTRPRSNRVGSTCNNDASGASAHAARQHDHQAADREKTSAWSSGQ
jgi:hypothetical protein